MDHAQHPPPSPSNLTNPINHPYSELKKLQILDKIEGGGEAVVFWFLIEGDWTAELYTW